jgi:hypothetical protein
VMTCLFFLVGGYEERFLLVCKAYLRWRAWFCCFGRQGDNPTA